MILYQIWKCIFLLFALHSQTNGCKEESTKGSIVAALLDLHSGKNCETVNFHGIQQLAGLQSALKEINLDFIPDEIEINLQVFDTCSTKKGTKIATLKALVASEQTCIHTPFFLGFIGNENQDNFEVSQSISKVFNMAHVLPYSFGLDTTANDNIHYISSYPVNQHTEAVKVLLDKLGLHNIAIIHDQVSVSKMKVRQLTERLKREVCFIKIVEFANHNHLEEEFQEGLIEDAVLIITENLNIFDESADFFNKYSKQIIISSGKIGFENSLYLFMKAAYILQFTSLLPLGNLSKYYNEDLAKIYNNQQLLKCTKNKKQFGNKCNSSVFMATQIRDKDWTVDLLQYGLILYGYSIRIAAFKRCRDADGSHGVCSQLNSLPQNEWNNVLKESSVFTQVKKGSDSEKINFNMKVKGKFDVYLLEKGLIKKVGEVEGANLVLHDEYEFPTKNKQNTIGECLPETITTKTTTTHSPSHDQPETSLIPFSAIFNFDISDFELIGFLSGIVFIILFLLGLFVYIIYVTMRVKSSRSDGSLRGSVNSEVL